MAAIFLDLPNLATPLGGAVVRRPVGPRFFVPVPTAIAGVAALPSPIPTDANAAIITPMGLNGESEQRPDLGILFCTSDPPISPSATVGGWINGEKAEQGYPAEVVSRAELTALRMISMSPTEGAMIAVQYYSAPRSQVFIGSIVVGGGSSGQSVSSVDQPPPDPNSPASFYDGTAQWAWDVVDQRWERITPRVETLPIAFAGQTEFTLSSPATVPSGSALSVNGVSQGFGVDFTVTGAALTYLGTLALQPSYTLQITYR